MAAGYQWFVAWRYLMSRPRKFSKPLFGGALILLIWWVRSLPQPWRGIVDGGVVLGLIILQFLHPP